MPQGGSERRADVGCELHQLEVVADAYRQAGQAARELATEVTEGHVFG